MRFCLIAVGAVMPFEVAYGCGPDDECTVGDSRCDGAFAMHCTIKYSDAHKTGNPYVWHREDCESPDLCKLDTYEGDRRAFCVIQPEPLAECANTTGYTCLGDRGVLCTDSHFGAAAFLESGSKKFECPSCEATEVDVRCVWVSDALGTCPRCYDTPIADVGGTSECLTGAQGSPGARCGCARWLEGSPCIPECDVGRCPSCDAGSSPWRCCTTGECGCAPSGEPAPTCE